MIEFNNSLCHINSRMTVKIFKTDLSKIGHSDVEARFDLFFYHRAIYLKAHAHCEIQTFLLYREDNPLPVALVRFVTSDGKEWESPLRAPFGSVQYCQSCSTAEIGFFIRSIVEHILKEDGTKLTIKHYPPCYLPGRSDLVHQALMVNGFLQSQIRLNHHIPVNTKLFQDIIHPAEKRRLKKCTSAHFTGGVDKMIDPCHIFDFLYACRMNKRYGLSLNKTQLTTLLSTFPTQTVIFTVKDQDRVIALSVVIQVSNQIVYNFLTDNLPAYRQYSPSVLLIESIYKYCQEKKIAVLDLGTSVDHLGFEKAGLVTFKENIGGISSQKITYSKQLVDLSKLSSAIY